MDEDLVSAEVFPVPGRATEAARALERLGLRVLHIGQTISVRGPASVWTSVFDVSFERRSRPRIRDVEDGDVTYLAPRTDEVRIPVELGDVVSRLSFAEPPELFTDG